MWKNTDLSINLTAGVDVRSHQLHQWTSSGTGTFLPANTLSTVYQHSPDDLAAGIPIQITLTAQPLAPCATPISDSFMLTLVENPTATVGPTAISICDTGHTFSQAAATNYQSIQWTNLTGTGTIQNSTSENATYIPSQADINAGTAITLRFTANLNQSMPGSCSTRCCCYHPAVCKSFMQVMMPSSVKEIYL